MKWFWYQRNILGRWSPIMSIDPPHKAPEGSAPKVRGLRKLEDRHSGWTLTDCMAEWPDENN